MVRTRVAARLTATGSGIDATVSARASSRWATQRARWASSRSRKDVQSVVGASDVVAAVRVELVMGVLQEGRGTRSAERLVRGGRPAEGFGVALSCRLRRPGPTI